MMQVATPAVPQTSSAWTAALARSAAGAVAGSATDAATVARARAFAEPLLAGETLETGTNTLAHADGVAALLGQIGAGPELQACTYLVYASEHLNRPRETIAKAFGADLAGVALETTKLVQLQRQTRLKTAALQAQREAARLLQGQPPTARSEPTELEANQTENVRKMLLAFSRDLRVLLLRLASRLQTLRYIAAAKIAPDAALARESLQVFAPLANRLGIWPLKWELEDLAFRFLEPHTYKQIARLLDEKRVERESLIAAMRQDLQRELGALGIAAEVQGRPKHIYSIVKKMRGKGLDFEQVYDLRALRVIVPQVDDCYRVLAYAHAHYQPLPEEFDDYIAKPKANGYQSLHTVVRDGQGRAFELQIRTRAMHEHAEHGVAAHWAYKEAGSKGYAGVSANSAYDAKIAVLRQLLAWQSEVGARAPTAAAPPSSATESAAQALFDDAIYVFTPQAEIVELPQGATALDFAYSVHTSLGHRCRGARVDGSMVSLNTALQSGQTVEILTAKEGGPSRDWLNPEQGYLVSHRAKAKVRAWFNAQAAQSTLARGRELLDKWLQREGKTALNLDELASRVGYSDSAELCQALGKDEISLRALEQLLHPTPVLQAPDAVALKKALLPDARAPRGSVLVVGLDTLMTQLARCCKPAPPDEIRGYVTRGKGVAVHRSDCPDYASLALRHPGRVIEVQWSGLRPQGEQPTHFPVDVTVEAGDRQGLLRDISDAFAREKINVIGVQTQSVKGVAWMTFTVEVPDATRVQRVMAVLHDVPGVRKVRRR